MKPPVDHVRVSTKGKDILIKIKRNTGLEHWNELCRIALCRSLANPSPPAKFDKTGDSAIDIEWKTFAGAYQQELSALVYYRANFDSINITQKDDLAEYFRSHLERGIISLQNIKSINLLLPIISV
jgi:DNA sulfur modification protein DndE